MIERAKPEQLNEIMRIWLTSNLSAHAFIPEEYWENAVDMVKDAMSAADLFVYLKNGVVAGFIGITGGDYIAGLFVDEAFRAEGIGRQLIDECKRRYPRLELDVFVNNTGALRFYNNNGFVITGTTTNRDVQQQEHHMVFPAP